jgi:hypothetical protein
MSDTNDFFRWPESPPYPAPDWWLTVGAELDLDEGQIKFAASLVNCGGADSRSNSVAARCAGLTLSRTEAYRLARSVKVRKLIDNAEEIKAGKRKPLTEEEIDARIDKMISSPNDMAAAKGIELRERRAASKAAQAKDEIDIQEELRLIANVSIELAQAYAQSKGIRWNPAENTPSNVIYLNEHTPEVTHDAT